MDQLTSILTLSFEISNKTLRHLPHPRAMAESILACSACLRRAIQLLPHQKAVLERRTVHNALLARPFIQGPRRFASAAKPAAALTTNDNDSNPTAEVDSAEYQKKLREKRVRAVNKELEYADDPWKIGQLVESSLKKDRYEEALLMTQKASKDHQVVVSWNHLISYKLEKQELRAAIKLYNDVSANNSSCATSDILIL